MKADEKAYIDWADEVFVPHQDIGHAEAEDDRQYPRSDETFDGLFG